MHKGFFQRRAIFKGREDVSLKAIYSIFFLPACSSPRYSSNGELKELDFTAVNSDCGQNKPQRRHGHIDWPMVGPSGHVEAPCVPRWTLGIDSRVLEVSRTSPNMSELSSNRLPSEQMRRDAPAHGYRDDDNSPAQQLLHDDANILHGAIWDRDYLH